MAPLQTLMEALAPEANTVDRKTLDTHVKDFDLHVDHIFQVGGFATACTTDVTSKIILYGEKLLEWIHSTQKEKQHPSHKTANQLTQHKCHTLSDVA